MPYPVYVLLETFKLNDVKVGLKQLQIDILTRASRVPKPKSL